MAGGRLVVWTVEFTGGKNLCFTEMEGSEGKAQTLLNVKIREQKTRAEIWTGGDRKSRKLPSANFLSQSFLLLNCCSENLNLHNLLPGAFKL